MVELSKAQDVEAGDGTTSVVVIAGALLEAAEKLLRSGMHPTIISDALQKAVVKVIEILTSMSVPIQLTDKESLIKSASTSLNSKVRNIGFQIITKFLRIEYHFLLVHVFSKTFQNL